MTDILKALDDAQRRAVATHKQRAADHPFPLVIGNLVGRVINCLILHHLGKRWGLPLRRIHWWFLLACFGRDPGYPYNLVWQVPSVDARAAKRKAAIDRLMADILKARDEERARRGGQPQPRAEAP